MENGPERPGPGRVLVVLALIMAVALVIVVVIAAAYWWTPGLIPVPVPTVSQA